MSFELFKPTLWSQRYINNTDKRLVFNQVVDTSWDIVGGKAMKINEIGDVTVSDYTSTGVTFQDIPDAQKEFPIDQKKKFFAGIKRLPDDPNKLVYSPSGEYFSTAHAAYSHASDKWGVPFPQGAPDYDEQALMNVKIPRHVKG